MMKQQNELIKKKSNGDNDQGCSIISTYTIATSEFVEHNKIAGAVVKDENDDVAEECPRKNGIKSQDDMTFDVLPSLDDQQQQQQQQKPQDQKHQRGAEEEGGEVGSSVRVAVRVRPFLSFEHGSDNCMQVLKPSPPSSSPQYKKGKTTASNKNDNDNSSNNNNNNNKEYDSDDEDKNTKAAVTATTIQVGGQESGPRFTFDQVFDNNTTQEELFRAAVSPLVDCCLEGYNATILAYGQTGSGKTHTMMGPSLTVKTSSTASTGGVRRGHLNRQSRRSRRCKQSSRNRNQKHQSQTQSQKQPEQQNDEYGNESENSNVFPNHGMNNTKYENNKNFSAIQEDHDFDDDNEHDDEEEDQTDNDRDTHDESDDMDDFFLDQKQLGCAGIIPRSIYSLFDKLEERKMKPSIDSSTKHSQTAAEGEISTGSKVLLGYQVSIQFLELYGEEIRDLLTDAHHRKTKKLTIRDLGTDEPEVVGATHRTVLTAEEALLCLSHGLLRRVTGATAMNESSSRSHAILSVLVEQQYTQSINNHCANGSDIQVTHSRFHFVDLAGSERQKRTQAAGQRLKEGIDINKGLLVLGNVISALGDPKKRGKTFVPYRDSKLTRLLKGSLGGNHKTLMIACVSPSSNNIEESLNCLRYANRAKNIQNNAVIHVDGPTRLIQELQSHVQLLASDLVKLLHQQPISTTSSFVIKTSYPPHVLESMANGSVTSSSGTHLTLSPSVKMSNDTIRTITTPPTSLASTRSIQQCSSIVHRNDSPIAVSPTAAFASTVAMPLATLSTGHQEQHWEKRFLEMEIELSKVQSSLRQIQKNHDAAEEELYVMKAQKELAELQLSVILSSDNGTSSDTSPTRGGSNNCHVCLIPQEVYLKKAVLYEKEIGKLKSALIDAQAKIDGMRWALNRNTSIGQEYDERDIQTIEEAEQQLLIDRQQLVMLQQQHRQEHSPELLLSQVEQNFNDKNYDNQIDEGQMQNDAEGIKLTKPCTFHQGSSDPDESDCLNNKLKLQETIGTTISTTMNTRTSESKITTTLSEVDNANTPQLSLLSTTQLSSSSVSQRERKVQADLAELSRSISAKENLIDQLRKSQEKYATMRDVYEDRLLRMEVLLSEKEQEREKLLLDLKQSKDGGHPAGSKDIEEKIGLKEKHIADLRTRQQELMKLTAVSSRNDIEINRLHDEFQSMKRLKVDLQKKIADEQKSHVKQMKALQKCAMLKDKELNNAKRILARRELEAARATQVAKQRLDELALLRLKYKDSEKKLRMASLQRMASTKAGVDPFVVGRRGNTPQLPGSDNATFGRHRKSSALNCRGASEKTAIDVINVDNLRLYFDQKVACVVQKEDIVEKLAREWEEHFELSNCKQEFLEHRNITGESEDLDEAHHALMTQIQSKEERIRNLASRLRKSENFFDDKKINHLILTKYDTFLFDKEFTNICEGLKPNKSHVVAARVLFSMIVTERRRVAALAWTATYLNERVQVAEREAELNKEALRAHMEQQRRELIYICIYIFITFKCILFYNSERIFL